MAKDGKPAPQPPIHVQKGYQPKIVVDGYRPGPNPNNGHQPTGGQGSTAKPPSNPPNEGTSGKK